MVTQVSAVGNPYTRQYSVLCDWPCLIVIILERKSVHTLVMKAKFKIERTEGTRPVSQHLRQL